MGDVQKESPVENPIVKIQTPSSKEYFTGEMWL